MKDINKTVYDFFDEFLDILSSANSQIILEYYIQFQFKKMNNRLLLLDQKLGSELPFIKYITFMNNILEEEFFSQEYYLHDKDLYESRSKQLFSVLEEELEEIQESETGKDTDMLESPSRPRETSKAGADTLIPSEQVNQIEFNIEIAKEAKMSKFLVESLRELGGRIYFNEEYDSYFGKGSEDKSRLGASQLMQGEGGDGSMPDLAALLQMLG